MIQKLRILLLGCTGYIGGSVLTELLKDKSARLSISALVRKPEQIEKLKEIGVRGLLFKSLDDYNTIREAASQHDLVIGAASARHVDCAKACIEGLSERKESPHGPVQYIHTSGGSMLGDWPESGGRVDTVYHSDLREDIFTLEREIPEDFSPVRKLNQVVVTLGEEKGVKTYIVSPPLIFGRGTGPFTEGSGQLHMLVQLSLPKKQSVMVGSGSGVWSYVHINDLGRLYALIVQSILNREEIPNGKTGYYFAENGSESWKNMAMGIAKEGRDLGVFDNETVGALSLQEVADVFYSGSVRDAEGVLASNARTKADRAREVLKWSPDFGTSEFRREIRDVVAIMSKK